MKTLLAVVLLSLPAVRARASGEAVAASGATGWREAIAREVVDPAARERWAKLAVEAKKGRTAATDDEMMRWDFIDDEKALTMSMSHKTFDRYAELYRRWQEDPALRIKYKDNSNAYLGSVGARDAAAILDAIVTPLSGGERIERLPISDTIIGFLMGTLQAAERIDSGQFDLFGSDVGDFFNDRLHHGAAGGARSLKRTTRRMRVRVRPHGALSESKVAFVYSANPSYELLRDGRFEVGVELVPLNGAEVTRGWVGVTRPWPGER